jgi:hypothetical protein
VIWIVLLSVILVGIIIVLIQQMRESANRKSSEKKMADIMFALHSFAAQNNERVPSRKNWSSSVVDPQDIPDFFLSLAPHLNIPNNPKEALEKYPPYGRVKALLDSGDPSTSIVLQEAPESASIRPNCSYASNVAAFTGTCNLRDSYPDGLSNTIGIATHYMICGEDFRQKAFDWTLRESKDKDFSRRATFADPLYRDALPVTNTSHGQNYTFGYHSFQHWMFQTKPSQKMCESFVPQAYYSSGLIVGMMDKSIRVFSPTTANHIFWSAVTPNANEAID